MVVRNSGFVVRVVGYMHLPQNETLIFPKSDIRNPNTKLLTKLVR